MGKILLIGMVAIEGALLYRQLKRDGILDSAKQKVTDYVDSVKESYNEGRHDVQAS